MSSVNLNDQDAMEMPEDYMVPNDVLEVGNWMNNNFSFIPQCKFDISNLPPPPPMPTAKDAVAKLMIEFNDLTNRTTALTQEFQKASRQCDNLPPDRKYWEMIKKSHDQGVLKAHKEVQQKFTRVSKMLDNAMSLQDSGPYRDQLKTVYNGLDDLEYDYLVDQYNESREDMENRLTKVEEGCKKWIADMRALEKDWFDLETNAKIDLPYESWHPTLGRNQFAALMSRYGVLLDEMPKARTVEATEVAADGQSTVEHVTQSLTNMLNELMDKKKVDYVAKAKEFGQRCQEVVLAAEKKDFPIDSWNPISGGKEWNKLSVEAVRLQNETKLIKDRKEIDLALGLFEDVRQILGEHVARVKNQKSVETMLAPDILSAGTQIKAIGVELNRLAGVADNYLQAAALVVQGVNCENNEQRKAAWNNLDSSCLPLPGSDWTNAKGAYEAVTAELQRLSKFLPWMPENLKAIVSEFSSLTNVYNNCTQKSEAAFNLYGHHADEVLNFDSDIDLGDLAALGQNADQLTADFTRIGNLAAEFLLAVPALNDLSGEDLRREFNKFDTSWRPGADDSAWDESEEMLEALDSSYEGFEQSISWISQSLQEVQSKIDAARNEMEFKQDDINKANDAYELILPLIGQDDDVQEEFDEGDDNDLLDPEMVTDGNEVTPGDDVNDIDSVYGEEPRDVDDIDDEELKLSDEELEKLSEITQRINDAMNEVDADIKLIRQQIK